jgi:hypothetical protein
VHSASLSAQQLRRPADIKDKIQSLEDVLEQILSSSKPESTAAPKQRRKMSAAGPEWLRRLKRDGQRSRPPKSN